MIHRIIESNPEEAQKRIGWKNTAHIAEIVQ